MRRPIALLMVLLMPGLPAPAVPKAIIHRGSFSVSAGLEALPVASLDHLATLTVAWAWWAQMGEPVQDFEITWKWNEAGLRELELGQVRLEGSTEPRMVRAGELQGYPDLWRRLLALKPAALELEVEVLLFDAETRGTNYPFARLPKRIKPDLLGQGGRPAALHTPGSPAWSAFFLAPRDGWRNSTGIGAKAHAELTAFLEKPESRERGAFNRKLFAMAQRFHVQYPKVVNIAWPKTEFQALAEAYAQRLAPKGKAPVPNPFAKAEVPGMASNPFVAASAKAEGLGEKVRIKGVDYVDRHPRVSENPFDREARILQENSSPLFVVIQERTEEAISLTSGNLSNAQLEELRRGSRDERAYLPQSYVVAGPIQVGRIPAEQVQALSIGEDGHVPDNSPCLKGGLWDAVKRWATGLGLSRQVVNHRFRYLSVFTSTSLEFFTSREKAEACIAQRVDKGYRRAEMPAPPDFKS